MKRLIIQSLLFTESLDLLIDQHKILQEDYEELERRLIQDPEDGDLIQGTGGLRKTRVKSPSGGKSGGFRVCYYDISVRGRLYLLFIYGKNVQENLTPEEKKFLKKLVETLKKEAGR
ncbi:MAG: type II toxin-antitoxin system RelE/ParE family toxin [Chlamydiota bacterium]